MNDKSLSNLDDRGATALLREASIERQTQSGTLDPSNVEPIREGKQDQSIGFDDAKFALVHADTLWDKAQQSMTKYEGAQA